MTGRLPPLVPGWPLIGNAIELAADPVQFWVQTAKKFGPAYMFMRLTGSGRTCA
ncbi:MAG TPA: hypothetical protein VLL56_10395 [Terriglobia bacterium]|nr:hypothetical protein [Terriglobia bacterium]